MTTHKSFDVIFSHFKIFFDSFELFFSYFAFGISSFQYIQRRFPVVKIMTAMTTAPGTFEASAPEDQAECNHPENDDEYPGESP
jgi:hypothetical protein